MQARAAALRVGLPLPGKAVGDKREFAWPAQIAKVRKPHQRILHVGRDDFQIIRINGCQLQHGSVPRQPFHVGPAGLQLFFQSLKTPVKMIDPVDHGVAFCHKACDHQ